MLNTFFLLGCLLCIVLSQNVLGMRIKRGIEHLANGKVETFTSLKHSKNEENKLKSNNFDDMECSVKDDNNKIFESKFIESSRHVSSINETEKAHQDIGGDEKDKIKGEIYVPLNLVILGNTTSKNVSSKGVKKDALQDASIKHKDDKDMEELRHTRAQAHDASAETKLDTKKLFKPDLDIFMYRKMPQLHKVPPFYDLFNTKEELAPYEKLYPFKWLQRRSPIQNAFEIANMMVKVGLDEMDSDDYNEQLPFFETNSKMSYRNDRNPERYFCPLHTLQNPIEGNNVGPKVLEVCSCHLIKKASENDHEQAKAKEFDG